VVAPETALATTGAPGALPQWVWWTGGALAVGGLIWFLMSGNKKTEKAEKAGKAEE
jgi:hypothetical protein